MERLDCAETVPNCLFGPLPWANMLPVQSFVPQLMEVMQISPPVHVTRHACLVFVGDGCRTFALVMSVIWASRRA